MTAPSGPFSSPGLMNTCDNASAGRRRKLNGSYSPEAAKSFASRGLPDGPRRTLTLTGDWDGDGLALGRLDRHFLRLGEDQRLVDQRPLLGRRILAVVRDEQLDLGRCRRRYCQNAESHNGCEL